MAYVIGLDIGEKRIGVALSETTTGIAVPHDTLGFKGNQDLLNQLEKLRQEYPFDKVVVGLPKTLRGEEGPAARKVIQLVEWLKARAPIEFVLWDERLTTQEVERILLDADISREKRKDARDRLAAQRILQSYLDASSHGGAG